MEDALLKKINEIHESPYFAVFVETGEAGIVAHKLMMVAGSSATVFGLDVPYNKLIQGGYQQFSSHRGETIRAVSKENVQSLIQHSQHHVLNYKFSKKNPKPNNIFANSFQVGDETNKVSTHGWIGLCDGPNECEKYYHVSLHKPMSREQYINRIAEIGIELIHNSLTNNLSVPVDCGIDMYHIIPNGYRGQDKDKIPSSWMSLLIDSCARTKDIHGIFIDEAGKQGRMEEYFREKERIVLYKGSFNPIHNVHVELANIAEKTYGTKPVFVISTDTYEKHGAQAEDIEERVRNITKLGFPVMVMNKGYFKDGVDYIRQKFQQEIVFVVGSDTFNRLIETSHKEVSDFKRDFENVKFFLRDRHGKEMSERTPEFRDYIYITNEHGKSPMSSTKIRELLHEGKHEELKTMVPESVYNELIAKHNTVKA